MSFIMRPIRFASTGHIIEGSGLFDGSSGFLSRTPASAGNRKTFIIDIICKRSKLGANERIFEAQVDGNNFIYGYWRSNNTLEFSQYTDPGYDLRYNTNQVFRDVAAYMNLRFEVDTTAGTGERVKILLNGTRITSFATETEPSLNFSTDWNTTNPHYIGYSSAGSGLYFTGYASRFVHLDGQTSGSMAETTDDGFWQINDASGLTFGTNGFLIEGGVDMSRGQDSKATVTDATVVNTASEVKDGTSRTNLSYASVAIGTADTNRKIVVVATGGIGGGTHSSMVIGGVSATLVAQESAGANNHSSMWEAAVPNGTTATIAYTTSVADIRNAIGVWAVYDASDVYYSSATSTADPLSAGGMTIPAGGVGIGGCYNGNTSAFTWVGLTEDYDELVFDAQYHSGASGAFSTFQDALTVTGDPGTGSSPTGCFASWGPAGLNHFTKTGTITATNDSPTNGDA